MTAAAYKWPLPVQQTFFPCARHTAQDRQAGASVLEVKEKKCQTKKHCGKMSKDKGVTKTWQSGYTAYLPSHRWDISSGYTIALHCWPATTNHLPRPCSPWSFPLCPDHAARARKLSQKEETYYLLLTRIFFSGFDYINYIASFLDIRWWITKWNCFPTVSNTEHYNNLCARSYVDDLTLNSGRFGNVTSLISLKYGLLPCDASPWYYELSQELSKLTPTHTS